MYTNITRLKHQIVFAPRNSSELFKAMVRLCKRRTSKKGASRLETRKLKALECVKLASKFATEKLKNIALKSPFIEDLHPFFKELLAVSVDIDSYRSCSARIHGASRIIKRIAYLHLSEIRRARRIGEVAAFEREFFGRALSILKDLDDCFIEVRRFQEIFQTLPDIDTTIPTVVIAGAPNVGKSSLLRRLTRAQPEVKPYPFTTKELIVGHLTHSLGKIQLIDTPGLLDSPIEEKKSTEQKAIIALRHISDLVLFLVDPTETCGFSLDYQRRVLESVKSIVNCEVWVIVNKVDITSPEHIENFKKKFMVDEFIPVSAEKSINIESVKSKIVDFFACPPRPI
jgi:nucleolar GTP-binding protein